MAVDEPFAAGLADAKSGDGENPPIKPEATKSEADESPSNPTQNAISDNDPVKTSASSARQDTNLQRGKAEEPEPSLLSETQFGITRRGDQEQQGAESKVLTEGQEQETRHLVDGSPVGPPFQRNQSEPLESEVRADEAAVGASEKVVPQAEDEAEETSSTAARIPDDSDGIRVPQGQDNFNQRPIEKDPKDPYPPEGHTSFRTDLERASTLQNIAKIGIAYFGAESGKTEPKEEPPDVTRPYPKRPADLPRFDAGSLVATWERELASRRLIVLGCLHVRVLKAAAYDLLESELLANHERRLLDFDLVQGEALTELSLDSLAESKLEADASRVVVINLSSRQFLDTMFRDLSLLWRIQGLLADRQSYILGLISTSDILDAFDAKLAESQEKEDERRYFFERILFLRPLLATHFPSPKVSDLSDKIEEQRAAGLWGESEQEFFQWIRHYLQEGPRKLEQEVEARGCKVSGASALDLRRVVETVDAAELFEKTDDIGRTVLYAVAHFPDLHPDEFERLMLVLLEDRTMEVEVIEEETGPDGVARPVTRRKLHPLEELWWKGPDGFLRDSHTQVVEQEDGSYAIDFTEPYLRRDLLRVLRQRQPLYVRHRLGRIVETGFLFKPEDRSGFRSRALELVVKIALADPGTFDEWLFTRCMTWLKSLPGNAQPDAWEGASFDGESPLLSLLRLTPGDGLRRQVLAGLADLMREMLRHDRLQPAVETWLDRLLKSRHHGEALRLVLDILRALRFGRGFDSVRWFRRLLDESPEEARSEVYRAFFQSGIELQFRIYDLLEPLSECLPDPEKENPPERPSSRFALEWMVDYCFLTLKRFNRRRAGDWPSSYPLFATFSDPDARTGERLRLVVRWLFHPGMKWIVREGSEDGEDRLWTLRAAVVEEWYWILVGGCIGSEEGVGAGGSVARLVADELLSQVLAATSSMDRARLLDLWRRWRAGYLRPLNLPGIDRTETAQYAKQRRQCSLLLERRFKEIYSERR